MAKESNVNLPFGQPHIGTQKDGEGILFEFKNGARISIIFGSGSYSKCSDDGPELTKRSSKWCSNAEVMVTADKATLKKCFKEHDSSDLSGYVEPDRLAEIMQCVAKKGKKQ